MLRPTYFCFFPKFFNLQLLLEAQAAAVPFRHFRMHPGDRSPREEPTALHAPGAGLAAESGAREAAERTRLEFRIGGRPHKVTPVIPVEGAAGFGSSTNNALSTCTSDSRGSHSRRCFSRGPALRRLRTASRAPRPTPRQGPAPAPTCLSGLRSSPGPRRSRRGSRTARPGRGSSTDRGGGRSSAPRSSSCREPRRTPWTASGARQ